MLHNKLWSVAFAALIIVTLVVTGAPAAQAQEPTTTIIFDGKALTGSTAELTDFVINDLRPAVAQDVNPTELADGPMTSYTPASCFGVTEKMSNGMYLLRETVFKTDLSKGRFDAVIPAAGSHADWPPHGVLFSLASSQMLSCDELVAEISWRLRYTPDAAGSLTFSFMLNEQYPEAYDTMASGGDLGLFVASTTATTMTINGETFVSAGCVDCLAYTKATTSTIGAGFYDANTVDWFGNVVTNAPALTGMYVLPVSRENVGLHSVTVTLDPAAFQNGNKPVVYFWYGRFDKFSKTD